jgi:hypothetical protein
MARILKSKSKNSRKFSTATRVSTTSANSVGVNSPLNNTLVTVASDTTSLDSERVLTFDGSRLSVQAGMVYKRREVTSATTLSSDDYYIACKITSTSVVTLPATTTLTSGQTFVFKDESGSLSDSVVLNLTAAEGETIEGVSTFSINHPNASIFVYTDGAGKYFIY